MQTYLPYANFKLSAQVLSDKHIKKQRSETKQILRTLLGESKAFAHHPAVEMWRGHERTLATYGIYVCQEWNMRTQNDDMYHWFEAHRVKMAGRIPQWKRHMVLPPWFGQPLLHQSHRSNLMSLDRKHYEQFWKDEPVGLDLIWPTIEEEEF